MEKESLNLNGTEKRVAVFENETRCRYEGIFGIYDDSR